MLLRVPFIEFLRTLGKNQNGFFLFFALVRWVEIRSKGPEPSRQLFIFLEI
jgi:hypothetical protein